MRTFFLSIFLAAACGVFLAACGHADDPAVGAPPPSPKPAIDLARTSHGVAHIRAADFRGLGFGLAYAYAQDNVCMFADSLLTVRGERSQFFGGEARATRRVNGEYGVASDYIDLKNEDSDFFFKGYLDIEELKAGYAAASQEARDMLAGYAAGYNRYLKDSAGNLPAACRDAAWVRPITLEDVYLVIAEKALHASGEVFAAEIVAGARDPGVVSPVVARRMPRKSDQSFLMARLDKLTREQLGSNALAVGKELSASGKGLLLGNPHYPWTSTDRFYQAHLTVPGRYDAMGVILGGIPIVVIGFNKDVAWTHTVTTAVHFTTFKLAIDPRDGSGTSYLSDGESVKMRSKQVTVDLRQPDGSMSKRSKTFYFSKQGAVIVKPEAGIAWSNTAVHVLADPNRNNTRLIDQWLGIGSANSVRGVKAVLDKTIGLPWVNTVAADREGNVLYADASVVPKVPGERFASDCMVAPALLMFDGSRAACGWGQDPAALSSVFSPVEGPWMMRSDYVGNSNDSYWLTNPHALLTGGYSPLYGRTGAEQKLRTRMGFRQMEEMLAQRKQLGLTDLQELVFSNRINAAEMMLPQLLAMCAVSGDRSLIEASEALAAWDRRADLDSRGAVLFREFWNRAATIQNKWAVPFNPADPVNTPNTLSSAAGPAMLAALKSAAQALKDLNIPLDARLGDYQGETRQGVRTPIHGGIGDIDGAYNSIHMVGALGAKGYEDVAWGTSYVQTVSFDESGPVAKAMLVYGQSTDPQSPYFADQLPLYSRKEFPALPFSQEQIKGDPHYKSITLTE